MLRTMRALCALNASNVCPASLLVARRARASRERGANKFSAGRTRATAQSAIRKQKDMIESVKKAYSDTVTARVKANGGSSWGGADSVAVIEAITDAAYLDGEAPGFDAIRELVSELVNPSAFRQKLEKLPPTHAAYVRPGEKGKRGGTSAALTMLGGV